MPEINLPEVKLPDIKLPDGLRDMTKDDIVEAAKDVRLPNDVKIRNVRMPKKIEMPDIGLSRIELPNAISDRLPGRRRTNPMIPLLALTVVGLAFVAAWWLFTSAATGPRVRRAVDDLRSRMSSEPSDVIRYDDEGNLGSLVDQELSTSSPYASEPFGENEVGEMGYDAGVAVGPGTTVEERAPLG